jgi:hypothetical protein
MNLPFSGRGSTGGCVQVSSEELKRFEASLLLDGDMP